MTASWRRRGDAVLLRWQARLDGEWADRVLPWGGSVVLGVLLFAVGWARHRGFEAGADLGAHVQAAWKIGEGHGGFVDGFGGEFLAENASVAFYPVAYLTRILPNVPTLLGAQAAALALGVVPLWRIAREVAHLRVGAAIVLVVAYGAHPTIHEIATDDFHPAAFVLPAIVAMVLAAHNQHWLWFWIFGLAALAARADVGILIAGFGLVLAAGGERRHGLRMAAVAAIWAVVGLVLVQPLLGDGTFGYAQSFPGYGDTPWEVGRFMLAHPFTVIADLGARVNAATVVGMLGPLLFLPLLAPRHLVPAVPLLALYFAADGQVSAAGGFERLAGVLAFTFVAAAFALARLGRPSVERVLVDARVLLVVAVAALGSFALDSPVSPYERPWEWAERDAHDGALHDAITRVPDDIAVRVPATALASVAERPVARVLPVPLPSAAAAAEGVDAVLVDARAPGVSSVDASVLGTGLRAAGFTRTFSGDGVDLYLRE